MAMLNPAVEPIASVPRKSRRVAAMVDLFSEWIEQRYSPFDIADADPLQMER